MLRPSDNPDFHCDDANSPSYIPRKGYDHVLVEPHRGLLQKCPQKYLA
jgi:hypothetical protein